MARPTRSKPQKSTSRNVSLRRITAMYKEEFSGPIPPPQILLKYEEASRGAANRIISMAENQAAHRRELESKVLTSNIHNERLGMYFAFILTLTLMVLGTYLLMNDKAVEGFIAIFAPAIFQAGNYIYNRYIERKRAQKDQSQEGAKEIEA